MSSIDSLPVVLPATGSFLNIQSKRGAFHVSLAEYLVTIFHSKHANFDTGVGFADPSASFNSEL